MAPLPIRTDATAGPATGADEAMIAQCETPESMNAQPSARAVADDAAVVEIEYGSEVAAYGEALDTIGCSLFSLKIFCLAGLGWISDGAEAAVLSYMLPALRVQYELKEADLGYLSSILCAAQALGALFWGCLADIIGRRPAFLASVGLTAVLGIASAAASSMYAYVVLRAATGFAIGGNLPLAVTVTSELLPPRHRDRALVALHLFYEAGALSSTGLALALMPSSCKAGSRCEWPTYLVLVATPAACVSVLAACQLPESVLWLASKGRHPEARAVLAKAMRSGAAANTANASPLEPPVARFEDAAAQASCAPANGAACRRGGADAKLLSWLHALPALLRPATALTCALWFTADVSSGWWTWLPELASLQGVPAGNMYAASIVGRVVAGGAFLVAMLLIRYVPARALLLGCLLGACALSALLSLWAASPALFASPSLVPLYGAFALFFGGLWSLMYVVTPPLFPADVRGLGFGLASACSKLGYVTSPLVASRLAETSILGMGAFFTAGWACAAACLAALILVLRGRGDRPAAPPTPAYASAAAGTDHSSARADGGA